jgi:hypothetical protein
MSGGARGHIRRLIVSLAPRRLKPRTEPGARQRVALAVAIDVRVIRQRFLLGGGAGPVDTQNISRGPLGIGHVRRVAALSDRPR